MQKAKLIRRSRMKNVIRAKGANFSFDGDFEPAGNRLIQITLMTTRSCRIYESSFAGGAAILTESIEARGLTITRKFY